jgi:N-acetylneuraminic acid mutarotase
MLDQLLFAALALAAPESLTGHAGAVVRDKVFICGGMGLKNEGHFFREAWLVDPIKGDWTPLPEAQVARGMAAAVELNGSVYLAGGFTWSGETLGSVERFDLKTSRWTTVASLGVPRSRLSMVALDDKLYAVSGMRGGRQTNGALNEPSIEEYDPAKNTWRVAGKLNHARHGFALTTWQGRIYVFGGNDGETETSGEVWDPKTGKSADLPNMPISRGFGGVVVRDGRMICFGGHPPGSHPSGFNPDTATWKEVAAPDIELRRMVSFVLAGKLWTIGGENRAPIPIIQSFDISSWK